MKNIGRAVIVIRGTAVGGDIAVQSPVDFRIIRDVAVDYQSAVGRKECRKLMKGMPDIFQIFEKVQMILFYI